MTGTTPVLSRAKVVALALATTLLAGGALATASVASAAPHHGTTSANVTTADTHALGKWPRKGTSGKKW